MVVGGNHYIINGKGERTKILIYPTQPNIIRWNMLLGNGLVVSNGAALMRIDLLAKIGLYGNFRAGQDFEYWSRMFDKVPIPIANMESIIYLYRQHCQTNTNTLKDTQEAVAVSTRRQRSKNCWAKKFPQMQLRHTATPVMIIRISGR